MNNDKPREKDRAGLFLKTAFEALDKAGGNLPVREVMAHIEKAVPLTPHEREAHQKTGYIRWQSLVHFYSIDCVKAGFLKKAGGRWFLTQEGKAVMTLSGEEIVSRARKAYQAWKAGQADRAPEIAELNDSTDKTKDVEELNRKLHYEFAADTAAQEIRDHITGMGPYEFQDLVAATLRGMGYSTPVVAPPGPDGGTDIIAYRDPLGIQKPHLRVQVKHRMGTRSSREEIAALRGIVRSDREIGMFVSSGGFAKPAVDEARQGAAHIELVDLDRLLELWIEHYDRLSEEDRALLRLRKVYFLAPE